ncbi:MAG TPA: sulfatase, partial [Rhodobiaceae bacterium]|nr:sulfatase [Rhodobiaceae bacterium]
PPQSELHRHPWRDTPLPEFYPGSKEKIEKVLADKPRHWMEWYKGERVTNFEAPPEFRACDMTADQVQEINAFTHVENELIDEAIAKVMAYVEKRGWGDDVDVVFTTDHGEFQGEFGLLFKGPYHVDALMRLPMIWRPAKSAKVSPSTVGKPVGQVDLAPTFCEIAGLPVPEWMQGKPMPKTDAEAEKQGRERVFTEWDC